MTALDRVSRLSPASRWIPPELRRRRHGPPLRGHRREPHYFVYIDPTMGTVIPHADVTFTGHWNNAGVFRFSNEVGATAACEFEGTGCGLAGRRFDDAGIAEVAIDGKIVGTVHQFGPGRDLPFEWSHRGLPGGRHTITLGASCPASRRVRATVPERGGLRGSTGRIESVYERVVLAP